MHHVAFRTHDLPRLERFYTEVLGFTIRTRAGQRSVWLDAGDAILMLERANEAEPGIPAGSMEFVAFSIRAEQRIPLGDRLARHGIAIEHSTDYTLYFRDPDGRRIGLSHFAVANV
ncbi:MAG TPA: VOC family protein [Polyangiaceae bacterium]